MSGPHLQFQPWRDIEAWGSLGNSKDSVKKSSCVCVCGVKTAPSLLLPQLCQFCVSSVVQHGIQIIQIEDKTTVINNTPYQILYKPQLSVSNPYSGKEVSNPQCGCSL